MDRVLRAVRGDHTDESEDTDVSHKRHTHLRHPHVNPSGYKASQVAAAYNVPKGFDGTGMTVGIIELGGAWTSSDGTTAGINTGNVTVVDVAGGSPVSDGPNGADGEVALDVEVVGQVAPGAKIRVYFCANTDASFDAGIEQAISDGVDAITISWGGPENQWPQATINLFETSFAKAKAKNIPVFAAAGDSGSKDGTRTNVTDYPASSPNVIGCGGTRLVLDPTSGTRISEVVWDDNPSNDATGGGISKQFPGRTVPDITGNADPVTGYIVTVDGQTGVIGGTSAVAPLCAAAYVVTKQANGGKAFDLLACLKAAPTVCFDVTSGNNGGYSATAGKDDVSGWGAVDWTKLLAALGGTTTTPAPPVTTPPTTTTPSPADVTLAAAMRAWLTATGL